MKRFGWVILLACAAAARGQEPSTRPSIEPLVKQLSAQNWKARQQAQDRIVQLGDEAVPRLEQLIKETGDEEVRSRAQAALRQIQANDKSAPTLITLHMKDAPAQTVLSEITRQGHAEIGTWPDYVRQRINAKVTIDAEKQPFWLVVRDFCRQAGLAPERVGGGRNRITLMQRGNAWGNQPYSNRGCFFIVAQGAQRSHTIDYNNPANRQTSFNINFVCFVDPKVRVTRASRMVKVTEAVDDKGNSLVLDQGRGAESYVSPWGGSWYWDLTVPLAYRADMGSKLVHLRGSTQFSIMTKSETWEVPNILGAKAVEKKLPGYRYIVHQLSKVGPTNYDLKVSIEFPREKQNELGMMDFGSIQQQIRLMDDQGRTYDAGGGGGGTRMGQADYDINFYSSNGGNGIGAPARLVWDIPLEIKDVEVPLEFDELPLP